MDEINLQGGEDEHLKDVVVSPNAVWWEGKRLNQEIVEEKEGTWQN